MLVAVILTLAGVSVLLATASFRRRRLALLEEARLAADLRYQALPDDERTAAHEAGHAIVAWVSPNVSRLTSVSIEEADADGVVRVVTRPVASDLDRWVGIAIALGGIAGEGVAFGRIRASGAGSDLSRALAWADELAEDGDPAASFPWHRPRTVSTLDVGAMFKERPSPAACAALNLGYRRAKEIVAMRPDKFDALRTLLRERRRLDAADVESVLGPRPWAVL